MTSEFYKLCVKFWYDHADPRSEDFLFLRTPFPILIVILIYVVLCKIVLPAIFKGEMHEWARPLLAFHYSIQFGNCIGAILIAPFLFYFTNFNLRCEPSVPTNSDGPHYLFFVLCYLWLLIKILDIIESFLLYLFAGAVPNFIFTHHLLFPLFLTIMMHFFGGGSPLMFAIFYSIDYGLYFFFLAIRMSSKKSRMSRDLWVKKNQFFTTLASMDASLLFYLQLEKRDDCNYQHFKYFAAIMSAAFFTLTMHYRAASAVKGREKTLDENENHVRATNAFDPT